MSDTVSRRTEEGRASLGLRLTSRSRVLVLGGYGVRNVGDEAILAGLLNQLGSVRAVTVVSRGPAETTAMHGVRAVSPAGALAALLRCDALLVGGGGMFSSDTGPFGRFIPLFCRLAMLRGIPVALHGVGVYASTPAHLLKSLASLAPRLASFTVRDAASARLLESIGVTAQQIADLSQSMAPAGRSEARAVLTAARLDLERPIVGLCPTEINARVAAYIETAVPALCRALPEVQFCVIPISQHQTNPRHDDAAFGHRLQESTPSLKVLEGVYHPAVVLAVFGELSAAVCVRYHSHLFAERAGVPVISIPYSEKCYGWLEETGVTGIDCEGDSLEKAVVEALDRSRRGVGAVA